MDRPLLSDGAGVEEWGTALGREALKASITIALALNLLNAYGIYQRGWIDVQYAWLLLDSEGNLATWFSAALLLACAGLAALCRELSPADRTTWAVVAIALVLMSAEEIAALRERFNSNVETDGGIEFAWVIPGSVAVVIAVVLLRPFVRRLPRPTAVGLTVGGAAYVAGSLMMEIVDGVWASNEGQLNAGYLWLTTIEENLELVGGILIALVLARHARSLHGALDGGGSA